MVLDESYPVFELVDKEDMVCIGMVAQNILTSPSQNNHFPFFSDFDDYIQGNVVIDGVSGIDALVIDDLGGLDVFQQGGIPDDLPEIKQWDQYR